MQQVPTTSCLEERYANMDWKKSISPFKIPVFNKATGEANGPSEKIVVFCYEYINEQYAPCSQSLHHSGHDY